MYLILENSNQIPYPVGSNMKSTMATITNMVEHLKNLYDPSDKLVLAVRGSSGAIIGGIISSLMLDYDVKIIHIKKQGEDSHNGSWKNSLERAQDEDMKLIIADDFISSGETVNAIANYIREDKVDTLVVSGSVDTSNLNFKPKHIIAGEIF